MGKNLKMSLALIVAAVVAVVVAAMSGGDDESVEGGAEPTSEENRLVRPNSQRLSVAEDGKVTFVEFLDFECEACGAAYPLIEEIRAKYQDRVTFVVRNFPLHNSSEAAASAAIAAADQDKFEAMYSKLFETQAEWGEKEVPQSEVFLGFAEELGLDMDRYNQVVADPATLEQIKRDKADGVALGVTGTPTFFLNGAKMEIESGDDIIRQIEAALGS